MVWYWDACSHVHNTFEGAFLEYCKNSVDTFTLGTRYLNTCPLTWRGAPGWSGGRCRLARAGQGSTNTELVSEVVIVHKDQIFNMYGIFINFYGNKYELCSCDSSSNLSNVRHLWVKSNLHVSQKTMSAAPVCVVGVWGVRSQCSVFMSQST